LAMDASAKRAARTPPRRTEAIIDPDASGAAAERTAWREALTTRAGLRR
jgi:hypothetical protein